jgi:PAS domain S-box-containing protein
MKTLTKLILANGLIAILVISTFAVLTFNRFHSEMVREVDADLERCLRTSWELLTQKGTEFRIVDGQLLAGNYVVNNNFEVPDKVQEIFGGVATIFMGDTRVSTNVLHANGRRAVGTRLKGPAYDAIFKDGKSFRGEALILGIPYRTAYDPIRDDQGEIIGVLFVGMKKTEFLAHFTGVRTELTLLLLGLLALFVTMMILLGRVTKKFQKMKEEQQAFAESLVQNTAVPTFVLDNRHRIIIWNRACEELTGVKAGEMIGSDQQWRPFYPEKRPVLADIVIDGNLDEWASLYDKVSRSPLTPAGVQGEGWYPALNGKDRFIFFDATPVYDSQGKIIAAIETLQDITERKHAEETLRWTEEELQKWNRELESKVEERTRQLFEIQEELVRGEKLAVLGQLSGSVGHELRNPLGVMSNAVYFLKMVLTDADETVREYLDIIKKEIDNSLYIITDLLDFARTRPPRTTTITTRQLTEESLNRCAIPENVALQTEIPDNLPRLRVDPLQIGQVLTNFITNAVQAMPDGGALRISARLVGAGLVPAQSLPAHEQEGQPQGLPLPPDFIAISVTDNGEGITPENMKKLFQPLFTTKAKGIGLGLVVCKNLVEANNGRIKVESEPAKGTTFTVLLPIERGETWTEN